MRRLAKSLGFWVALLAALAAAGVAYGLWGDPNAPGYRGRAAISVGDCVSILKEREPCDSDGAWYRLAAEKDSCAGHDETLDRAGTRFCLDRLGRIDVDVDVDP